MGAALGAVQVAAIARGIDQKTAQGHGLAHIAGKGVLAVFADEAVGVVLGRQKQKLDRAHVGGQRQRGIERLARRAPARAVAVKAEHHRIGKAKQLVHMLGRAGRAQRGHGVGKAQLRQRHHVHVAFGHQRKPKLAQGVAGFKQAVEFAPLAEHRGFGRIEVFGFVVAQHAAAKADVLALDVADREHHPVTKAVVALGLLALFFVQDHQATFHQQRVVVIGEHAGQAAPALGRVAQSKLLGDPSREPAALEISHGALGRPSGAFGRPGRPFPAPR